MDEKPACSALIPRLFASLCYERLDPKMVRKGEESKHDCKVDSMINIRMHSRRNGLLGVHRFIAALVCGGACDKMDERVMQHQGYCASWRWWRPPGNSGRTDGCDALEGIRDMTSQVSSMEKQDWVISKNGLAFSR